MEVLFWGKGNISCRVENSGLIVVHYRKLVNPTISIKGADIDSEYNGYFVLSGLSPVGSVSVEGTTFSWKLEGDKTVFRDNMGRKLWANLEGVIEEELLTEQERNLHNTKHEMVVNNKRKAAFIEIIMSGALVFLMARAIKWLFF